MEKDSQQPDNTAKHTHVSPQITTPTQDREIFITIRRVTALVMIMSAILFAFVGVLAIWKVLGEDASEVVWRAFSSLAVIAFAALVVNIASKTALNK